MKYYLLTIGGHDTEADAKDWAVQFCGIPPDEVEKWFKVVGYGRKSKDVEEAKKQ